MSKRTTEFTESELQAIARKVTFPRFISIPIGAAAMICAGEGWPTDHPLMTLTLVVLAAYMIFCWQSILHEAVHQTAYASPNVNIWGGRLLGLLGFTSYTLYREVHKSHHAYLNRPTDQELWPYVDPAASLTFRRCFAWFDLLFGVISFPLIFARAYLRKDSVITDPATRRTIRNELLGMLLFWTTIWTISIVNGQMLNHARGVLLPLFLAGVIQTGRKFTEHLGMKSYDPFMGTRTIVPSNWLIKICSFLNFDLFVHGPHHRYPRMSHDQLVPKMLEHEGRNPEVHYPVYPTYWRASLAMIPHLILNPGNGMNAGAEPPRAPKASTVGDFAGDVVHEILGEEPGDQTDVREA